MTLRSTSLNGHYSCGVLEFNVTVVNTTHAKRDMTGVTYSVYNSTLCLICCLMRSNTVYVVSSENFHVIKYIDPTIITMNFKGCVGSNFIKKLFSKFV